MSRILFQRGLRPFKPPPLFIFRASQPIQHKMMNFGSEAADNEPDKNIGSEAADNEPDKNIWDYVGRMDGRVAGFGKDLGDLKGEVQKSYGALKLDVVAGFLKTDGKLDRLQLKTDGKLDNLQLQLGLIMSAIVAFCGFAGYTIKRVVDVYLPQVVDPPPRGNPAESG